MTGGPAACFSGLSGCQVARQKLSRACTTWTLGSDSIPARRLVLQMAEVAVTRDLFAQILTRIRRLSPVPT